jgi:hypothetical protein
MTHVYLIQNARHFCIIIFSSISFDGACEDWLNTSRIASISWGSCSIFSPKPMRFSLSQLLDRNSKHIRHYIKLNTSQLSPGIPMHHLHWSHLLIKHLPYYYESWSNKQRTHKHQMAYQFSHASTLLDAHNCKRKERRLRSCEHVWSSKSCLVRKWLCFVFTCKVMNHHWDFVRFCELKPVESLGKHKNV